MATAAGDARATVEETGTADAPPLDDIEALRRELLRSRRDNAQFQLKVKNLSHALEGVQGQRHEAERAAIRSFIVENRATGPLVYEGVRLSVTSEQPVAAREQPPAPQPAPHFVVNSFAALDVSSRLASAHAGRRPHVRGSSRAAGVAAATGATPLATAADAAAGRAAGGGSWLDETSGAGAGSLPTPPRSVPPGVPRIAAGGGGVVGAATAGSVGVGPPMQQQHQPQRPPRDWSLSVGPEPPGPSDGDAPWRGGGGVGAAVGTDPLAAIEAAAALAAAGVSAPQLDDSLGFSGGGAEEEAEEEDEDEDEPPPPPLGSPSTASVGGQQQQAAAAGGGGGDEVHYFEPFLPPSTSGAARPPAFFYPSSADVPQSRRRHSLPVVAEVSPSDSTTR